MRPSTLPLGARKGRALYIGGWSAAEPIGTEAPSIRELSRKVWVGQGTMGEQFLTLFSVPRPYRTACRLLRNSHRNNVLHQRENPLITGLYSVGAASGKPVLGGIRAL